MTTEDESEDSFKERSGLKATCIQDLPTIESTKEVDEVEVKFDTSLKICCHHNLWCIVEWHIEQLAYH